MPALRIVIAGGGTGGHVFPALAIGRELRDKHGAECLFIGTARGIESRMVPDAGFRLELVRSGQLNRVSLKTRLKTLADLPLGVLHCINLLRTFKPQVVVGVGGYASGPAMLAATLLRIPMLAYEPNAVPGFTNRMLGKRVAAAAVNFPQTAGFFRNAEVTGVPVRKEIFTLPPKAPGTAPRLLITAGSNGALIFNETMPQIAARLLDAVPGLTIVHQSGPRALDATQSAYAKSGADFARWSVDAFLNDMPAQYAAADVILARAGTTTAELCAAGKASVLVPLPTAADDHQRKNAEVLAAFGATRMILQKDITPDTLFATLAELLTNDEERLRMEAAAKSLAKPEALERIAARILQLAAKEEGPAPKR